MKILLLNLFPHSFQTFQVDIVKKSTNKWICKGKSTLSWIFFQNVLLPNLKWFYF